MLSKIKDILSILINKDAVVVSKEKTLNLLNKNAILTVENKLARDRINSLTEEDLKDEELIEKTKRYEHIAKMALSLESVYISKIRYLELKLSSNCKIKSFDKFIKENPPKHEQPSEYVKYKPLKDDEEIFIKKQTISEITRISQDNGGINAIANKLSIYV